MDNEPQFEREEDGTPIALHVCMKCFGERQNMEARMYPSGHTEVMIDCDECSAEGELEAEIIEPTSPWSEFFGKEKYAYW